MLNNKKQPPPSRVPTTGELKEFAKHTNQLLSECIELLEPAKELSNQILLGIFTKELKMYKQMFAIADVGDSDTPPIVARILFELSLTFAYLVVNEDENPEYFDLFKKTALQRQYQMAVKTKKSIFSDRKSAKDMIHAIEKKLSREQFGAEDDSGKYPKSWLPDISYYQMANELGSEFPDMYITFYDATSTFAHPNWLDLTNNHLTTSAKGFISRKTSPSLSVLPLCTATCILLRTMEINAMRMLKLKNENGKNILERVQKLHYSLHNEKPDTFV